MAKMYILAKEEKELFNVHLIEKYDHLFRIFIIILLFYLFN
jgi:hypothetical protein